MDRPRPPLSLSLHLISSSLFLSSPLLTRPIPYPPSKPIDRYPFLSIRRPDLVSLGSVANCMSFAAFVRRGRRERERRKDGDEEEFVVGGAHGSSRARITLASRHHLYLRDTPRSRSRIVTGQGPYSRRLAPIRAVSFPPFFLSFFGRTIPPSIGFIRAPLRSGCDDSESVLNDDDSVGDGRESERSKGSEKKRGRRFNGMEMVGGNRPRHGASRPQIFHGYCQINHDLSAVWGIACINDAAFGIEAAFVFLPSGSL